MSVGDIDPRRAMNDDRAVFFCMLGLVIVFISTSWWLGLTEAFTISGTGIYLFGLLTLVSK